MILSKKTFKSGSHRYRLSIGAYSTNEGATWAFLVAKVNVFGFPKGPDEFMLEVMGNDHSLDKLATAALDAITSLSRDAWHEIPGLTKVLIDMLRVSDQRASMNVVLDALLGIGYTDGQPRISR